MSAAAPATRHRPRLSRRDGVPGVATALQAQSASSPAPTSATSAPARAKLPRLILKEVDRTRGVDGTERRTNTLDFEGVDIAEGSKALAESLSIDEDCLLNLLGELAGITQGRNEAIDCRNLSYAVSLMRGIGPKDQVEAMLAAQMVAVHMGTMSEASLLRHSNTPKTRDLHERTFNKLARTFTAQMAALKNHRAPPGQQKMVVEHVNVHEGGQAIVGHLERGA